MFNRKCLDSGVGQRMSYQVNSNTVSSIATTNKLVLDNLDNRLVLPKHELTN